ncbi:MAG: putative porin [Bacteroidales bacterium]|nr:putative porin [Candidatus Cacconaster merdequi]
MRAARTILAIILLSLTTWTEASSFNLRDTARFARSISPSVIQEPTIPDNDSTERRFFIPDSSLVAFVDSICFAHYDSLARFLPDTNDIRKAIRKNKREERDSIRANKPRILQTYAVPDSLYYTRTLIWNADSKFNELNLQQLDTSYNYHFNDYPMLRKDVNATYLGPIGSATLYDNYFKRETVADAPMFTPYIGDSDTPDNVRQFNTKVPYTELAYWGTLIANKKMEESELNLLTTQNITPALNITLSYRRLGSRGMLQNESTDHRNTYILANYMGKRYFMNAGMLRQRIIRQENGGIVDSFWIRDTLIDTKAIDVNLTSADNTLKRREYFIHHNLAIPMNFFRKDRDSLAAGEGTVAFIGHSLNYSTFSKEYTDQIGTGDKNGRSFYFNAFYMNSTSSKDELYVDRLENRLFIKLQPFAPDAVISKINGGIGYQTLWLKDLSYSSGDIFYPITDTQHNVYIYGGASGQFRKYFKWEADMDYYFAGYRMFDFDVNGKVTFSAYPIEKGIHLTGKFSTSLRTPHLFEQTILTNHHKWNNDFGKVSDTRIEGTLSIPKWHTEAFFGYSLLDNALYYDAASIIRQSSKPVSIMSASLSQDFRLWMFHFDNRVLFQLSSDEQVLPLPKLSFNLRYYFQFNVVKDVMQMQIGLNGLMHTAYYIPSYAPDLGQFYNQANEKVGGVPYVDAFVNVQWKRACVFVKYTNAFRGWPESDYFSAYHYIRPNRGFKFGIFWPFY